jgi:hypothetical protein
MSAGNTYNREVSQTQDQNSRQVTNYVGDPRLGTPYLGPEFEKYVANNLPAGSVSDEDNKAQVAQKLLDNQLNSNEEFAYGDEFDPQSEPNYGAAGGKVINNEKTEHENEPEQPGHNPFDGGSNKPLKSTPPGHPGALDANSVTKNSKLTEEDETRVGGSTGSYASELSLMLGGIAMLYVKGGTVKYANTSAGTGSSEEGAGVGSCKALGNDLNKVSEEQFEKNTFIPTEASRPDTFGDLTNVVRTKEGKVVRTSSGKPLFTKKG